ncbi:type II toxin-antitoxin system Phd/YefM family antitoxin [Thermomonospora cellulosilytica]|uniref:16S rRNA C1402 (Ribose-2'-O) methylase RsmI n=1 Tax=Thermomonospora cellulosilytica TaxID=1411118 RepID=A0A7W3N3X6_9ACTN|nr:hypothetical protein [Thermomonospora cellulosilytica]MBA9007118.1 16S rRNA C1402 (ribose-2'-O) methylase RsmI [Thermomonospora cellulosilytica]
MPERHDVREAETRLSRIIERVEHGDEAVISRAGEQVAGGPGPADPGRCLARPWRESGRLGMLWNS